MFIDDAYGGMTALYPVSTSDKKWHKKVANDERQLRIPLIPRGNHVLRIIAMPDFDFGPEQELVFPLVIDDKERVISIDILRGRLLYEDGTKERVRRNEGADDPFGELDELLSE